MRILSIEELSEFNPELEEFLREEYVLKNIVADFESNMSPLVDIRGEQGNGKMLWAAININSLDDFKDEDKIDTIKTRFQIASEKKRPKRKKKPR